MKASHFWMSRQATGRSVKQWREYMRVSACADATSWHTSQMEVPLLVSRCSVFVSTYSGSWLRLLGGFSWEVTALCSPFPPCLCLSVGGVHSRAGVAEMSHCTLNWWSIHWDLSTGCGGVNSGSSAPATCPPGLDSHSLHLHQMLLTAMSMHSEVWEGEEGKKIPFVQFYFQFHKMPPNTHMKHNLPLMDFLILLWKTYWRKIFCVCIWLCVCAFTAYVCHHFQTSLIAGGPCAVSKGAHSFLQAILLSTMVSE